MAFTANTLSLFYTFVCPCLCDTFRCEKGSTGKNWGNFDNMGFSNIEVIRNHYNAWTNVAKIKVNAFQFPKVNCTQANILKELQGLYIRCLISLLVVLWEKLLKKIPFGLTTFVWLNAYVTFNEGIESLAFSFSFSKQLNMNWWVEL